METPRRGRGATSIPQFTPSKSKGREETKACICSWGKECINLKTYFDSVGHALEGYKYADLTDTCDSQNFWKGVCSFLRPTKEQRDFIMAQYQKYIEDKDSDTDKEKKAKPPRFLIANHHFPLELIQAQQQPKSGNWTGPMTRERAIELNCYADRDGVPFYSDTLFQFNPNLGKGKSDTWKQKNKYMIRKVPCVGSNTGRRIAALHQAGGSAGRIDMNAIRITDERRRIERVEEQSRIEEEQEQIRVDRAATAERLRVERAATAERLRVERAATAERLRVERAETAERLRVEMAEEQTRKEEEQRTPGEWNTRLSQKDYCNAILTAENQSLSRENQSLIEKVKALKEQYNELDRKRNAEMTRNSREQKRMKEIHDANDVAGAGWHKVLKLLSKDGGLSRLTLFNDQWHNANKGAASKLWGYPSWKETKLYVKAYFPQDVYGVDTLYDPSKHIMVPKKGEEFSIPNVSKFEACLLCRMFYRTFTDQEIAGLIFGRHRTGVGKLLKEWGPRWGNVGEDLSCIDITRDYLFKECPDINIHLQRPKIVNVDGKDALIAPKRNDSTISKSTYSSKTEKDSTRWLAFSTAGGATFEKTSPVAARSGERSLVRWWGSLGPTNAPVREWEDVAKNDPWTVVDDVFWTALDEYLDAGTYEDMLQQLDNGNPLISNGTLDDGVLLTAQPTGLSREGLADATNDDSDEESGANNNKANATTMPTILEAEAIKKARSVFNVSLAYEMYEDMVKASAVEKSQRETGGKKRPPVLNPKTLEEQAQKALHNDPNSSAKRKLCQLERHQRLHLLYESGELSKCLFSYFLLVEEDNRLKLLSWMGSSMAAGVPKPTFDQLPAIPLRLAKIPEDYLLGGDKGFTGIEKDLPNLNIVDTPVQVTNSKTHRLSSEQIQSDISITTVRAQCETVFRRTADENVLNEKIPYYLIPFIPTALSLAHGEANIRQPLRYPGRNSIVGQDYWENVRRYTKISQPKQCERNVERSIRRQCMQCKTGGIVRLCANCKKWYHIDDACHDFANCNVVRNPYN